MKTTTKPCQFCGVPVPAACAIVGCVPCQKYNRLRMAKAHAARDAAWSSFEAWFKRAGHWIYRDRAHALATWQTQGIDGLPRYAAL